MAPPTPTPTHTRGGRCGGHRRAPCRYARARCCRTVARPGCAGKREAVALGQFGGVVATAEPRKGMATSPTSRPPRRHGGNEQGLQGLARAGKGLQGPAGVCKNLQGPLGLAKARRDLQRAARASN
eukprot:14494318-Alexandrium_andersonii.AAC.1